ncbi:MAG: NAD(P)/FAD-dependent oxidoreductase [Hyphomonadaceae bacterium]
MLRAAYNIIIIGAGAAGLYCAMHAARRGRRVLVLEHSSEVGAKILISGGGRCNFTNVNADDPERYLSANPHFARSALARHTAEDFLALVRAHGISYYEKTLGQLFCEGARSAHKIVRMLLDECAGQVEILTGCQIGSVRHTDRYIIDSNLGEFVSARLVVATGGLSIPKLGASSFAYDLASQFGVPVAAPRPALVPLTFSNQDVNWMRPLAGVSQEVAVSLGAARFREALLFTHRGLSGPAILQISSYWRAAKPIAIDWLPDHDFDFLQHMKRERPRQHIHSAVSKLMPARLAEALCEGLPEGELGERSDQMLDVAARQVKHTRVTPTGTEGYAKAEVTAGGIDTDALSQQTMECRHVPGLYFIGEAVDVTGWLGGYNFQWAWSSAWAAAQAL